MTLGVAVAVMKQYCSTVEVDFGNKAISLLNVALWLSSSCIIGKLGAIRSALSSPH